jgi:CheY-like chemotaxis protein
MPQPQPFSWKNSRILIADDEPDMREIFSAWFGNLGCVVTEAADGKEALDILARGRFDVIITDVRMPRLTGVQLVQQLHQHGSYTPVIIFVSGHVDLALPDAFDLGVEAVLTKPCDKKDLLNAVQRSLRRRDFIFEPPAHVAPLPPEDVISENFSLTATASQVAIGRGGLSLNVGEEAVPNSTVDFSLSFGSGPVTHLAGWGLLRWSEKETEGSRIGIEFIHLDAESVLQLARWIRDFSPVSFIPKDCHSQSAVSSP